MVFLKYLDFSLPENNNIPRNQWFILPEPRPRVCST